MRLTKFNPEKGQYEYVEKAKTWQEFHTQRKAVMQKLGELEDQIEQGSLAGEIFRELDKIIDVLALVGFDAQYFLDTYAAIKKMYTGREEQTAYLTAEMDRIFGKDGYPSTYIDKLEDL